MAGELEQNLGETFIKIRMELSTLEADMRILKAKMDKESTQLSNSFSQKLSKIKVGYDTSIFRLKIDQVRALNSRLKKELEQKIKMNADIFTIDKLKTKIQSTERALQGLKKEADSSLLGDFFAKGKNLLGALGITAAITGAVKLGKELFIDAARADSVRIAFEKLNQPGLLQNLRNETKNTVSDLDLMLASVRAANFKIPLDQLGKLLKFAQQRAKDTGQDVNYLVDSIIMGIGRKSPMILDNLGISAVELRKKMKGVSSETASIGDYAKAVGQIVDEEFERMGGTTDSAIDNVSRLSAAWKNFFTAIGGFLIPAGSALSKFATNLLESLTPIETNLDKVNESAKEQRFQFELLVTQYTRLRNTAEKNNVEAEQYKSVITQLKSLYPGFLSNLDLQKEKLEDIKTAYENVRKEIENNIRAELRKAEVLDLIKEQESLLNKKSSLQDQVAEIDAGIKLRVDGKIDDKDVYDKATQNYVKRSELLKRERQILLQDIKDYDKEIADYQSKIDSKFKGVDLTGNGGAGGKSGVGEQLSDNLQLLQKYFETVKFLDADYFEFRKKEWAAEAAELKKALGNQFNEEKFYQAKRKDLAKDYLDYVQNVMKDLANGSDVFKFDAKGEIQTPLTKDGQISKIPVELETNVTPPDMVPFTETTNEIVESWIESNELMSTTYQATMDAVANSFHELVRVRVSQDASAFTKIWADTANMVIFQIQRMIAKWIAFKAIMFGINVFTGGGASPITSAASAVASPGGAIPEAAKGGTFFGSPKGVKKMAGGGSFMVPSGFPNDSYPMLVQSHERVDVTPANRVNQLESMISGIHKNLGVLNANFVDLMIRQGDSQLNVKVNGELGNNQIYLSNEKERRMQKRYGG